MTSFGKFTLRFAAYGVVLLYLVCDLVLFHGPLYRRIQASRPDAPEAREDALARGVAAVVYGREITLAQLDHAARARFAAEGADPVGYDRLDPAQLRLRRYAALDDLIDHEILRVKVIHSSASLAVSDSEIDAAVARVAGRYAGESEFHAALEAAGLTPDAHRARVAARLQQLGYVESRVDPLAEPADPLARHRATRDFREALREHESQRDRILIRHEVIRGDDVPAPERTD